MFLEEAPYELSFSNVEEASSFMKEVRFFSPLGRVAGLDEVGRGSLCGPVVSCCVVLPEGHGISGIKDSKKLSAKRRDRLAEEIMDRASFYGVGECSPEEVDRLNIFNAAHVASVKAVEQCSFPIEFLLCDGGLYLKDNFNFPVKSIIKGDLWIECIGAASIVAKVYRDSQMKFYHDIWPEYGWSTNMGYGTSAHVEAIEKYGISPIHRTSFGVCKTAKRRTING